MTYGPFGVIDCTVVIYGCLNCLVTTMSTGPTEEIELKFRFTTPVASHNCASNKTPFIDNATYEFSSEFTVKDVDPVGIIELCETLIVVGIPTYGISEGSPIKWYISQ